MAKRSGKLAAAVALSRTVLSDEVQEVLADYRRLEDDDQRALYANHFVSRTAGVMDEIWPTFYELLKLIEDNELYRKPLYVGQGQQVAFESFQEYFEARVGKPFVTWAQLESTYQYAHKFMPELLAGSYKNAQEKKAAAAQATDAADVASDRPAGGNNNPTGRNQYSTEEAEDNVDNIHVDQRPSGTSESAALRRLRKDRPDLHAQVLSGEVSAHAASVEAGFRPKRFTVPNANNPASIVSTLRRQLDPETLAMVTKLLAEED